MSVVHSKRETSAGPEVFRCTRCAPCSRFHSEVPDSAQSAIAIARASWSPASWSPASWSQASQTQATDDLRVSDVFAPVALASGARHLKPIL